MRKPNILFIMTDQFRWDGLGKISPWMNTPALNRIAEEGVLFTNCITNSPVCVPARISLATGLYPHNTGVWSYVDYDMEKGTPTWMKAIQEAGYRTSIFGKSHLHRHKGDLRDREYLMKSYGFEDIYEIAGPRANRLAKSYMTEEWEKKGLLSGYIDDFEERFLNKEYVVRPSPLPLEDYADVHIAQKAKKYLQEYNDTRPWFCMLSFGGPHEPWDTPEPYASMYDPQSMPSAIPRPLSKGERSSKGYLDDLMATPRNSPPLTEEEISRLRADYAGNISLIDEQIGGILEVLEQRQQLDHTVIVFTSDHGEMLGDYGLLYKENFLKGSVNIPLMVRTPYTKQQNDLRTVYNGVVELNDIGPTLVDLAGGNLKHLQFGKSLIPVLDNQKISHRNSAFSEINGEVMLLTDEWKIALNKNGECYLLFNVREDPDEQVNLAASYSMKEVIATLKEMILQRILSSQIIF
ncbi:sulfatase family protein [Bacillus sp. SD088]|uniref:sulfatase family protein n=1 Tax=Bacillus sp. SD088 TaxID=2782012 RepID=UPI001A968AFF|nr:sulfatase-like hydrolase/transferase [Bacillus sp. SD088]MBO0993304.1 sulfatase-like hydrolase/transferase [Bacillus sp. SD088]